MLTLSVLMLILFLDLNGAVLRPEAISERSCVQMKIYFAKPSKFKNSGYV